MTERADSEQKNGQFRGAWVSNGRVKRRGIVLLFFLGLACTLAGAVPLLRALPVLLHSQRALATVASVDQLSDPDDYRIWVEFETAAGQAIRAPYELTERRRFRRLQAGERVEVFYVVDDPARIELYARQAFWVLGWLWMVPGLFMLWLSREALQSRRASPTPKKRPRK